MKLTAHAALTDVGVLRKANQDAVTVLPDLGLLAVADGMGGLEKGEVASAAAIGLVHDASKALGEIIQRVDSDPSTVSRMNLAGALEQINELASHRIQQLTHGANSGTTLVTAVIAGGHLMVSNVGDSRAYLFRDGSLRLLTDDHTVAAAQLRAGNMTPEEYEHSPYQHMLYQALGIRNELDPDIFDEPLAAGDLVLLCSDGLTGPVPDAALARILADGSDDLDELATTLVQHANDNGGPDNITVALARIDAQDLPGAQALEADRDALADSALGRGLTGLDLRILRHFMDHTVLQAGAEVDLGEGLHVVLAGSIEVDGATFGPGQIAGLPYFAQPSGDPPLAVAAEDGAALVLSRTAAEHLENRRPRAGARVYRALLRQAFGA